MNSWQLPMVRGDSPSPPSKISFRSGYKQMTGRLPALIAQNSLIDLTLSSEDRPFASRCYLQTFISYDCYADNEFHALHCFGVPALQFS